METTTLTSDADTGAPSGGAETPAVAEGAAPTDSTSAAGALFDWDGEINSLSENEWFSAQDEGVRQSLTAGLSKVRSNLERQWTEKNTRLSTEHRERMEALQERIDRASDTTAQLEEQRKLFLEAMKRDEGSQVLAEQHEAALARIESLLGEQGDLKTRLEAAQRRASVIENEATASLENALSGLRNKIAEKDTALAERDAAIAERDAQLQRIEAEKQRAEMDQLHSRALADAASHLPHLKDSEGKLDEAVNIAYALIDVELRTRGISDDALNAPTPEVARLAREAQDAVWSKVKLMFAAPAPANPKPEGAKPADAVANGGSPGGSVEKPDGQPGGMRFQPRGGNRIF